MPSYIVVLEASSAVRFDDGESVTLNAFPTRTGPVAVTWFTRHSPEGFDAPIPRELLVQVSGDADTLDSARDEFVEAGRVLTPYLALTANAAIDDPELLLAFDATPGMESRDFLQALRPTETGMFRSSRRLDPHLVGSVAIPVLGHAESDRLHRAVVHYAEALKAWLPGSHLRVLIHLWMAVEALTKAALRAEVAQRASRDALLREWGIERKQLDGEVRRRVIFHGDDDVHDTARTASDAVEHSFENFAAVQGDAARIRDRFASHIRSAIFEIAGINESIVGQLTSDPYDSPRESFPLSRFVRGKLTGAGDALAAPGNPYPRLDWQETIESISRNPDGSYRVTPTATITPRLAEGVQFAGGSYEVWGPRQDAATFTGVARKPPDNGSEAVNSDGPRPGPEGT